jgi:mRNA-degrading endonuclease YafQ of YafQ-DinJ toxin-antitoxin module
MSKDEIKQVMVRLTDQQVSDLLDRAPIVEAFVDSLRKHAKEHMEQGGILPGWQLAPKRATRKWVSEQSAKQALTDAGVPVDKLYTTDFISPAEAEKLLDKEQREILEGLTKKERLGMEREQTKLQASLGGIRDMGGIPDVMFVIDANKEDLAIKEAAVLGIPVIAVLDTNVDPSNIAFPVPGNDDAARAVRLYCQAIGDAALAGKGKFQADVSSDFGAMVEPPVEAVVEAPAEVAAEEAPVAEVVADIVADIVADEAADA